MSLPFLRIPIKLVNAPKEKPDDVNANGPPDPKTDSVFWLRRKENLHYCVNVPNLNPYFRKVSDIHDTLKTRMEASMEKEFTNNNVKIKKLSFKNEAWPKKIYWKFALDHAELKKTTKPGEYTKWFAFTSKTYSTVDPIWLLAELMSKVEDDEKKDVYNVILENLIRDQGYVVEEKKKLKPSAPAASGGGGGGGGAGTGGNFTLGNFIPLAEAGFELGLEACFEADFGTGDGGGEEELLHLTSQISENFMDSENYAPKTLLSMSKQVRNMPRYIFSYPLLRNAVFAISAEIYDTRYKPKHKGLQKNILNSWPVFNFLDITNTKSQEFFVLLANMRNMLNKLSHPSEINYMEWDNMDGKNELESNRPILPWFNSLFLFSILKHQQILDNDPDADRRCWRDIIAEINWFEQTMFWYCVSLMLTKTSREQFFPEQQRHILAFVGSVAHIYYNVDDPDPKTFDEFMEDMMDSINPQHRTSKQFRDDQDNVQNKYRRILNQAKQFFKARELFFYADAENNQNEYDRVVAKSQFNAWIFGQDKASWFFDRL